MAEFWEKSFRDKNEMWGFEPADAAIETATSFLKNGFNKILIPGFGYGRNAKVFTDNGFDVTGIEISETAIAMAKKHYGDQLKIHHGSVNDMPFDQELYDGIFCYALIHLLDKTQRLKLLDDCYNQLRPGGQMVFVAISTKSATYGAGEKIGHNRFQTPHGVQLFFYDRDAIEEEFGKFGMVEANEIEEPKKNVENKPSQKFWQITCEKKENQTQ